MRSRRGIGVLAVCGLVLGLMAISASGAQAGMWMIEGKNVSTSLKIEATVELEGGSATLLSTSGGNKVAITCTKAVVTSALVTLEEIEGTVNFSGCTTKINEKAAAECEPKAQPIAAGGTIKAVLHENAAKEKLKYAKVEGEKGVFATFHFECASLPETVKVTGIGWLEDCKNEFEVEKQTHLVQEGKAAATALGGLFFGANAASIDGSANVSLAGAHKGMTFSGLAE